MDSRFFYCTICAPRFQSVFSRVARRGGLCYNGHRKGEVSAVFFPEIRSKEDIIRLIDEVGFLPFFRGEIEGFSIEESVRVLWSDEADGPWEWKGPIIRESGCAYGKFYRGKACYVSREWFPELANYRRDGYDYDARVDDGLARHKDERIMEVLAQRPSLLSKELKALACVGEDSRKGFDQSLTFLQMQGYITTVNFEYQLDRYGRPYGWGVARYATPENAFGQDFTERVYRSAPAESRERIRAHLAQLLPQASQAQIERFLG